MQLLDPRLVLRIARCLLNLCNQTLPSGALRELDGASDQRCHSLLLGPRDRCLSEDQPSWLVRLPKSNTYVARARS